jgi:hypothetical protein
MRKILALAVLCGAVFVTTSQVYAACPTPTPVNHQLDSFFRCADGKGPIAAYMYQINNPAINSGVTTFMCRALDGINCIQGGSGVIGDGQATVEADWIVATMNGCVTGRVAIAVECNDGQGYLVSLSGLDPSIAYKVEAAHFPDPTGAAPVVPLDPGPGDGMAAIQQVTGTSLTLKFTQPTVYNDCDTESAGYIFSAGATCGDSWRPGGADIKHGGLGRILQSLQPCGLAPDLVVGTKWTVPANITTNADGSSTIAYTAPAAPNCLFFGNTATLLNPTTQAPTESPAVIGFVQLPPPTAASPRASQVAVEKSAGKAIVSWRTESELGLAGFKVMAESKAKGSFEVSGMITPLGVSGAGSPYKVTLNLGDFKGAHTVIIRSFLSNGGTLDSDKASF